MVLWSLEQKRNYYKGKNTNKTIIKEKNNNLDINC